MLTVLISWLHRGVLSGQHWLTGHQHSMTTVMLRMQVSLNRSLTSTCTQSGSCARFHDFYNLKIDAAGEGVDAYVIDT